MATFQSGGYTLAYDDLPGTGAGTVVHVAGSDGTVLAATSKYAPGTTVWCETHQVFHDRRADPDATYNTTGAIRNIRVKSLAKSD